MLTNPPPGLRVFTCGHSFHAWVGDLLATLAKSAGITNHRVAGVSSIGASRALAHWDVPDETNVAKKSLREAAVDVLTLSCMSYPDEGIALFAKLAAEHNPGVRVLLQELWLPEDRFPFNHLSRAHKSVDEFNNATMPHLRQQHERYFAVMEYHVRAVNAEIGQPILSIVPDAQAVLALRELILAGKAPGLTKQSDLFRDPWGHPNAHIKLLAAYTHFAVIYRRSPLGLPMPTNIDPDLAPCPPELNETLQHLAWQAATTHPHTGLTH